MTDTPNAVPQFWQDAPATTATPDASAFWKPSGAIGQGGTEGQARAFADEMVRTGAMTREAADAKLAEGGHTAAPADPRSDEAKQFDATFAAPPAPEGYRLDYIGRVPAGTETQTIAEFHQVATGWLSEIGLPANVGASVIERAMEAGQRAAQMSPPERELWKREQAAVFDRIAKTPERAAQLRAHAELVLASATTRADFSQALQKSPGAIHDATVLMNLALHGERLAARRGMK